MQSRISKILLAALFVLGTSSCGRVLVTDREWCGLMGEHGAYCTHTLRDESRQLTKEEWEAMSVGQICTADPPGHEGETFGEMKALIDKLCRASKLCTYAEKKKLDRFFNRMGSFNTP